MSGELVVGGGRPAVLMSQCQHDHGERLGQHDHGERLGHHQDDADDANAPIVAHRVTGLLARMTAAAAAGASMRGISPRQEDRR